MTQTLPPDGVAAPARSRHPGWALVLISIAQLMVVLDATIANIALPYIQRDLDISDANLQWIVTGYALAFGGLLLLGGRLGDLFGRRRIFMVGLTVFAVASAVGGLAQNELMLLGSRGLQGVGAAMASPAALALITTTFAAGPARNRAFSVYAAMSGAGAAVGLLLGGWLTGLQPDFLGLSIDGWRLTFLINFPIGLAAAALATRLLPESESRTGALDLPGALTATLGLVGIVYGLSRAGDQRYGWGDPYTLAALVVGVALVALFIVVERRVAEPLLPLRILADRTRATAFVAMMIVPAAMFGMFFFLSLFVQNVMGYSPLHTGFAFLPFSVGIVLGAALSSRLIASTDPRVLSGVGTLMAAIGLFGFSRLAVDDGAPALLGGAGSQQAFLGQDVSYWTSIFPFVVVMAIGMGLTFVPMTLCAVHNVGSDDSGIGSGVLNTMQQVGGALGLAALSTVFVHFSQSRGEQIGSALRGAAQGGGSGDPQTAATLQGLIGQAAQTGGSSAAYLTAAGMMLAASAIIWVFLDVTHEDLASESGPEGVHAG